MSKSTAKPTAKPTAKESKDDVGANARAFVNALESFKSGFSDSDAENLREATKKFIGE